MKQSKVHLMPTDNFKTQFILTVSPTGNMDWYADREFLCSL
jgi:hypothetical protein